MMWITVISYGQSTAEANKNNLESLISEIMTAKRQNKEAPHLTDERLKQESPERTLSLLKQYEDDNSFSVQHLVYFYEKKIADLHSTPEIRQRVVESMVRHLIDPKSQIRRDCYRWLSGFTEKDFNGESKKLLTQQFTEKKVPHFRVILICGVANIQDGLPILEKLLIDEAAHQKDPKNHTEWYFTSGWYARLARARMGVREDIAKCIELIENEIRINDEIPEILLNNIGYIRQPESIKCLRVF